MASASSNMNDQDTNVAEPFKRQGSLRKVLPSAPSVDSQLSMSVKMIDRPTVLNRGNLIAYSQYQQEYCTISEYNMLRKQNLPGIYVIPSAQTSLVWFGVIFIRQGMYQGGVFRFNVYLPESFPDGGCPRVVFLTPLFHPMVNMDTGEINIKSGFQEWRKNVNHIWQILQFIRRAFYKIETRTPLNKEAAQLYENDQEGFQEKVRKCVQNSLQHVYDTPATDDPHYISFDPYDEELHGPIREFIFKSQDEDVGSSSVGLSWVEPGSLKPFSKLSS